VRGCDCGPCENSATLEDQSRALERAHDPIDGIAVEDVFSMRMRRLLVHDYRCR